VNGSLADVLRDHGYRVTTPRRLVFETLATAGGHLTVDDIAARIQAQDDDVNLATIYRALALLADLDLVRESRLGENGASHWELAHPDEHFHMVCRDCGSVEHHTGTLVQSVRDHLSHGHGFEAEQVELTVTGRCATCATG
jgi:Fur family transcriptional regulator, ferric uptake regulator